MAGRRGELFHVQAHQPARLRRLRSGGVGRAGRDVHALDVARGRVECQGGDRRAGQAEIEADLGLRAAGGDGRFDVENEGVVTGRSDGDREAVLAGVEGGELRPVEGGAHEERLAPAERDGRTRLCGPKRIGELEGRDELLAALLDPPADGTRSGRHRLPGGQFLFQRVHTVEELLELLRRERDAFAVRAATEPQKRPVRELHDERLGVALRFGLRRIGGLLERLVFGWLGRQPECTCEQKREGQKAKTAP
ncbi:hypothetical protein [Frigoriglobus tundricola]|uniref:hypothetical protein n=1 Tax=Frigoriglobus tundricola TaxID=2774151 RepID=UPI00148EAD46|nr:hypothetical protein [Frigoriglobus tundricola]